MTNDKELQLTDLAAWARAKMQGPPDVDGPVRVWFVTPRNEMLQVSICEMRESGHWFKGNALILAGGPTGANLIQATFEAGDTVTWGLPIDLKTDEKGKPIPVVALVVASYNGD